MQNLNENHLNDRDIIPKMQNLNRLSDSDEDYEFNRVDIEDVYANDDQKFREGEHVTNSVDEILKNRKDKRKPLRPVFVVEKVPVEMTPLPSLLPTVLGSKPKTWGLPPTAPAVPTTFQEKKSEPSQPKRTPMPEDVKQSYLNTRMCDFAKNCKRKMCTFAHTIEEFSPMMCNFDRRCRNRDTCRFKHSDETKEEFIVRLGIKS